MAIVDILQKTEEVAWEIFQLNFKYISWESIS
jgi:hypothetical protein